MKRALSLILTLGITSAGLAVTAPAASADTPGCVSRAEFRRVEKTMQIARVHRIFDTSGKQTSVGFGYQSREYKACSDPKYGFVYVDYQRRDGTWRVTSKYAYWG